MGTLIDSLVRADTGIVNAGSVGGLDYGLGTAALEYNFNNLAPASFTWNGSIVTAHSNDSGSISPGQQIVFVGVGETGDGNHCTMQIGFYDNGAHLIGSLIQMSPTDISVPPFPFLAPTGAASYTITMVGLTDPLGVPPADTYTCRYSVLTSAWYQLPTLVNEGFLIQIYSSAVAHAEKSGGDAQVALYLTQPSIPDYTVEVDVSFEGAGGSGNSYPTLGLVARCNDGSGGLGWVDAYILAILWEGSVFTGTFHLVLYRQVGGDGFGIDGTVTSLYDQDLTGSFNTNPTYPLRLDVAGSNPVSLTVWFNGVQQTVVMDSDATRITHTGYVGMISTDTPGSTGNME